MKRIIAVLLVSIMMMAGIAQAAEISLSDLTWDELVTLSEKLTVEMMGRDQWQTVTVPKGLYQVGKEIPAGKWEVSCAGNYATIITYGYNLDSLNKFEYPFNFNTIKLGESYTCTLSDGMYIDIDVDDAQFTTYTGPGFSFK